METIVSRRNPLVLRCRLLHHGRPPGDPSMLLDGWHLVHDALRARRALDVIAVSGTALSAPPPELEAVLELARARAVQTVRVTDEVLEAMSPVRTPSGVVALAPAPAWRLEDLAAPAPAFVVIAVDVQDPGNVGAVVRAADAAGASGVAVTGASADPWGWKALRGAMGSAFRLPVVRDRDAAAVVAAMRATGARILAAAPPASRTPAARSLYDVDLRGASALLLGSEGRGLPDSVAAIADEALFVPMREDVESLNVATAAAVIAYEGWRQRHAAPRG